MPKKITGKDILNTYNKLYKDLVGASQDDLDHFEKAYDEWIKKIIDALKAGKSIQPHVSLGKNYQAKKTKALMTRLGIERAKNQAELTEKLKQALLGENKMSKKKKEVLNEGIIMMSGLTPVMGPKLSLSMRGNKQDNFEFKGLPGQFDKDGKKIMDEYGQPISSEEAKPGDYDYEPIEDEKLDELNEYAIKTVVKNIKSYLDREGDNKHKVAAELIEVIKAHIK